MTSKFLETFEIDLQPVTEVDQLASQCSASPARSDAVPPASAALPTAPKMSPSTIRADGTALVIALRTWASFTEPPVRNTASMSPAAQPRLREAVLDAGRDALGQLPGMADEIGAADLGAEAGRRPIPAGCQPGACRTGAILASSTSIASVWPRCSWTTRTSRSSSSGSLASLPDLTDIGHHARFVHAVDAGPGGEVVEIARRHVEPGALHGAAEAEQRHHDAEAELAVEIGAADAHAIIGENIRRAIGLAVTLAAQDARSKSRTCRRRYRRSTRLPLM